MGVVGGWLCRTSTLFGSSRAVPALLRIPSASAREGLRFWQQASCRRGALVRAISSAAGLNPPGCVRSGLLPDRARQRRRLCRRNAATPLGESLNREPCSRACNAGDELPCKDRFARRCSSRSSTNAVHRNGSDPTYAADLRERIVHHLDPSLRISFP